MTKRVSGGRGAATMRDVAVAASVSVMTVSNVLNGRLDMMSEETRKRVEAAIERLNYRRHAGARGLRLAKKFSIGMLVVDRSPQFLTDPFITYLVAGLSNALGRNDYSLVLRGLDLSGLEAATLIRNSETDALCVLLSGPPAERRAALERLTSADQPVLLFQERFDRGEADCAVVRQDDYGGGAALARLLVQRGAGRMLLVVPELPWPAVEERERGIRAAAAGADITTIRCGDGDFDAVRRALAGGALDPLPDAILAANDQIGIAALSILADRGIGVPGDVMVTGFNCFPFRRYGRPLLTSIRSPAYELGTIAAGEVLHRLSEGAWSRRETVLPVSLERGESA